MIRHVFKLVWNRKRSTGLILVEILVCFLALCGILATGLHLLIEWRKPLGFDYENVWLVEISGMQHGAKGEQLESDRRALSDMLRVVDAFAEVESVAASTNTPFSFSTWSTGTWIGGEPVSVLYTVTTAELSDVLHTNLLHGRWLEATDPALEHTPVVLTRNLARGLFGNDDPIGRDVPKFDSEGKPKEPEDEADLYRVVGVLDDYRRRGMVEPTPYAMFLAMDLENGDEVSTEMLVRVRPGTTAEFEERLVLALQEVQPRWSYQTTLLEDRRRNTILSHVMPVLLSSVVAGFLITMVGLGLVGVLWLGVTRRTAELGLRRAMGASGVAVRRQIVGELWALTALAVAIGALVFLQLPMLGVNFGAGWPVFLGGTALATLVIYAIVTICGLYPAWLATRVRPATALQYE